MPHTYRRVGIQIDWLGARAPQYLVTLPQHGDTWKTRRRFACQQAFQKCRQCLFPFAADDGIGAQSQHLFYAGRGMGATGDDKGRGR